MCEWGPNIGLPGLGPMVLGRLLCDRGQVVRSPGLAPRTPRVGRSIPPAFGCKEVQDFRNPALLWNSASLVGGVALHAHGVRTVATISGRTPVNHPTMYPPSQPI